MNKKVLKYMFIAALTTAVMTSCDDDGYSVDNFAISWGTAESETVIIRDDGAKLNIVTTLFPFLNIEAGDRLLLDYTILGDGKTPKSYSIRLNRYDKILSKAPVKQSFIDEDFDKRNDSIGNSPIEVNEAWFSAGKYLNVDFSIGVLDKNIRHFINVVQDDVTVDATRGDSVYLTMRHNAYDDVPRYRAFGYVSFDIEQIVPVGKESVPVKLLWTDYDGHKHFDTGTFTLRQQSDAIVVKSAKSRSSKTGQTPLEVQ